MRIAIRTDASVQIGTGHVMRCLTLADRLKGAGAECVFICRPHLGNLLEFISQREHRTISLGGKSSRVPSVPPDERSTHLSWLGTDWATDAGQTIDTLGSEGVDLLVVDHYALDSKWEGALRSSCNRLMVIDDLADRAHDCDLLLDQNLGRTATNYSGLVPTSAELLIGPAYALLRPEFSDYRAESLAGRESCRFNRLLITMGGVDSNNMTCAVLDVLKSLKLPTDFEVTVVLGKSASWIQRVKSKAMEMPCRTTLLIDVCDMARIMTKSDFAIGAAGSTSWERCCLGLPALQMVLAPNQESIAAAIDEIGAARTVSQESLKATLGLIFEDQNSREAFLAQSKTAREVADGGGAMTVARKLLEILS